MYAYNAGAGAGADMIAALTHELDNHGAWITGSGGGKTTDLVNRLIRQFGWPEKFMKVMLCARTCTLDLPERETLDEYVELIRNLPPTVKFNPYWILLLLQRFGPQWLCDWIEVINEIMCEL